MSTPAARKAFPAERLSERALGQRHVNRYNIARREADAGAGVDLRLPQRQRELVVGSVDPVDMDRLQAGKIESIRVGKRRGGCRHDNDIAVIENHAEFSELQRLGKTDRQRCAGNIDGADASIASRAAMLAEVSAAMFVALSDSLIASMPMVRYVPRFAEGMDRRLAAVSTSDVLKPVPKAMPAALTRAIVTRETSMSDDAVIDVAPAVTISLRSADESAESPSVVTFRSSVSPSARRAPTASKAWI